MAPASIHCSDAAYIAVSQEKIGGPAAGVRQAAQFFTFSIM
jgi:hypothetical protein